MYEQTFQVAERIAQTLVELGVDQLFGVVGSGNFHLTNHLRDKGVPFVAARHEGGAATMADAYARMSGKLGVVTTHQGCGYTNAVTGIAEAAKSRTPLLVLTADTPPHDVRSNFRIDQDGLARSVGAVAERVYSPATAVADTRRAVRTAVNDRRTVVLSVPIDVQVAGTAYASPQPIPPRQRPRASERHTQALAELLRGARRPLFIAGRGAREAGPQLRALGQKSGALLATSAVAHGLFVGEDHNLGISGGFSSDFTAATIAEADVVVGWGCALNNWTTRRGTLLNEFARVIQVDLDETAFEWDHGIVGDCAATAESVLAELVDHAPDTWRTPDMAAAIAAKSRWKDAETADVSTGALIDPRILTRRLNEMLPAERVVSVDSGNFMGYPSTYLDVPDENGFCFTQAFQSIGLGLATAIGAAKAQPGRLPVLGAGDGGFLMGIAELETAVRERIPLVAIVYNDSAYGAEVHHFTGAGDYGAVTFPTTDIAAVARGFGAEGVVVEKLADLDAVQEWLDGPRTGPLVVDARIASDGGAWWLAEAFATH
ncbi:thiamine pyrophosphate-binding protein [Corynebacterium guangdongense]|uniref:acetolactate synthase n=1 Tax=Corynebacterium guangdongense TaxID=1783348 RepID=A0ABU2A0Y2_9CORY|nr:thiamine pyrophosphate-binding protein [Corynebacterium guangdongense]MDR7330844.1 thiamine pyrophosphate-dependent acetolactate synthase large subunit-like protein [Corynebacterium guangdongense]WJZ16859.1 Sulfoacetaldehyde acetyltransferase [Corynebacterium guangdongense]